MIFASTLISDAVEFWVHGSSCLTGVINPESKGAGGLKVPGTYSSAPDTVEFWVHGSSCLTCAINPESKGAGGLKVPGTYSSAPTR